MCFFSIKNPSYLEESIHLDHFILNNFIKTRIVAKIILDQKMELILFPLQV